MNKDILIKLFEHNNWANEQMIQTCLALRDEQLDAEPQSATRGTIRRTLLHLVHSQAGYFSLLTLPVDERKDPAPAFTELKESARRSGEGLLALITEENNFPKTRLQTRDGYDAEPWVVMVQIINHATEHREQINSMLSALGITPPALDGWSFGEATNTLVPTAK